MHTYAAVWNHYGGDNSHYDVCVESYFISSPLTFVSPQAALQPIGLSGIHSPELPTSYSAVPSLIPATHPAQHFPYVSTSRELTLGYDAAPQSPAPEHKFRSTAELEFASRGVQSCRVGTVDEASLSPGLAQTGARAYEIGASDAVVDNPKPPKRSL